MQSFQIGLNDISIIGSIIVLFLFSLVPLIIKLSSRSSLNHFIILMYAVTGIVFSLGWTLVYSDAHTSAFANAVVIDGLTIVTTVLLHLVALICLALLYDNISTRQEQFPEYVFLLLNSMVGLLIFLWANDLIVAFIGLETVSLALYIMIALSKEELFSKEAAFKYFTLGSIASAFFLFGICYIFGAAGTTYLSELKSLVGELMTSSQIFIFGVVMLILGFCFKISIFPFQAWTPDVYQGAPTPVTAFMATGVKFVSFVALLRFVLTGTLKESSDLVIVFQWLAVLTMLVGNIGAILQNDFKRLIAYSSVAHSGYAFVGILVAGMSSTPAVGATGLLFYLFTYSVMTIGALTIVSMFEQSENSAIKLDDLRGLATAHPLLALFLTIFLLSLAGIPPALGFFGKLYLFSSAVGEGLVWVVVWGVLSSVISVYYYLRPVVLMYMYPPEHSRPLDSVHLTRLAGAICATVIVIVGILSSPAYRAIERALFGYL